MFKKLKTQTKILIGIPLFFASIYFLIKSFKKGGDNVFSNTSNNIILMGGLDNRQGDLKIDQQVELLKSTLENKNVIGFRYNDISGVTNAISENPNSVVVLFSAGCNYANKISTQIKNKNNLFIVEPYATSQNIKNIVNEAIENGVPNKNVIVGENVSRGLNVVPNPTHTPSNTSHWNALKFVGTLIK
jgi:hypothetical protein